MITKVEKRYLVYMHIFPNGKRYVGITGQNVKARWRKNGNGYKPQCYVYKAIEKYGWDNITHSVVAENLTIDEASQLEKDLISKHQTTNPAFGYNLSTGGENSPIGVKRSAETRKKLSDAHKGKPSKKGYHISEERKAHLRQINLGKKLSDETKKKISEKNKGQKPSLKATRRAIEACSKPVIRLCDGERYESATVASRTTGEHRNTITRHCRNEV